MLAGQPFMHKNLLKAIAAGLLITLSFSCTVVKKYQPGKPFVYKTNINLIGNFSKDTAEQLESGLYNQLDDSLRPRSISKIIWSVQKNPPLFDAANADKSIIFMRALLNSLGYFNDSITYDTTVVVEKSDQYRTTVDFNVKPGKQVKLDSIWYSLKNPELQRITMANMKETLLKKGEAFAKGPISGELDRLVEVYRDNGFLRFNREELIGVWDTVDVDLLRPTIDPFEQLDILRKLAERRQNPTANLEIRLRPNYDSSKLVKYYIGTVNIYPDFRPDTVGRVRESIQVAKDMFVIQHHGKFKPRIFPINIYLKHDSLYRQRRFQRTLNRLNSLGTWAQVNIRSMPRSGQDTVDFNIELTPDDKYLFNANVEASQNSSAISGNLFGVGVNFGVLNRNLWKGANQSSFNFRYGVEFGSKFIQTQQASISYNIYFPRPIPAFKKWLPERWRDNVRTVFSFNAANTERRLLFNLTTINGSWGYEFTQNQTRNRNVAWQVIWKFPNIEYSYLRERDSLKTLIQANPALKSIFTDGFIASTVIGVTRSNTKEKTPRILSFNLEFNILPKFINNRFLDTHLYRFVKLSSDFTQLFKLRRNSSVVLHAFAGIGYEFNSTVNPIKRTHLPFFKQYFAGGPNSMRAWRLRRLGPGSVIKSFVENPERYGDVQLEFNAEYRFLLAKIAGVKLESVLFTDIGNVWLMKKEAGLPEEVFNFGRLVKDLGVGVGTGLRVDFTYFLLRLDYAFKAKDPSPDTLEGQNKWFYNFKPFAGQLQIGINYPFKL
jgi:outer membrane protein insertion porin family